ncbi:MAG: GGDEF domain-containing protein [Candidatus Eremiobacteraeota bacterium]|nr:GGDEF domain-containing protein [Candidatus Eremiobacteraeota bacterium]
MKLLWWRALAPSRELRAARSCLLRERARLGALTASIAASRSSSAAVFSALERSIAAVYPAADAVIAFAVDEHELVCIFSAGARSEHFRNVRLLREDARALPARAAERRCRCISGENGPPLLPTDRFAVAVPLLDAADVRAVVYAGSHRAAPTDLEAVVQTIEAVAIPYAIAVERETDRRDALQDGLTGLLAPRPFRRQLHEEIARIEASGCQSILSLWFVDTDEFKNVNDTFGHRAGDGVLQTMASLLRAHLLPGTDVAARNGGDEFCALVRATTKAAAIARAQRFLDAVRRHDFGIPIPVTASIGVASYPHDAASSSALLEAADAAMYRSKRDGRNRVSFALEAGTFASAAPEAETPSSRSPERWPASSAASSSQRLS